MAALQLQTEGFVLLRRPPSDAFQTLQVFSGEHGALTVLQRIGRQATTPAFDLFDEVAWQLESSNQGRTWFVREARLLQLHESIGRSYAALLEASALASLIGRNPVHEDSRGAVAALLRTALAAFGSSDRPDIVHLKALYRFAREEGHPLREHWFPSLPAADRALATTLLNQPLAGQDAPAGDVLRLRRHLEDYLRGHTEIMVE